jgi:hypothetical protein
METAQTGVLRTFAKAGAAAESEDENAQSPVAFLAKICNRPAKRNAFSLSVFPSCFVPSLSW